MKKLFITNLLIVLSLISFAKGYQTNYTSSGTSHNVSFELGKWDIQEVSFDGVTYNQIVFDVTTVTEKKGWAQLPFISASVQIAADKDYDVNVIDATYKDYQLSYPLVPSRGVIYRNQNPETIPYQIASESLVDEFYPSDLATADSPYIIRDVRGTAVRVYPFRYNAATNTLRVYSNVTVQLSENNNTPTNPLYNTNLTPLREMEDMYQSLFINYSKSRMDLPVAQFGDILVIYTSRDQEAIQPYITWKKEMGYNVEEELVATGTNVVSLIQQKYNANPNILYVQLVGDWADVKTNTVSGEPADPKAGCVVGTDNLPEIAVGRFSCNNVSQLTVQVNKTINYEKNPDMTDSWRSSALGIASNQGPGDDGEIDYTHVGRIYSERLNPVLDYNQFYTEYDPSASASGVTAAVNAGVSTIAYTGHGSQTSWGTTGFSNSNVNSLSNGAKLPFITSVACNNGTFESGDCFAEAWLRKENGGAIVTWMSSISQPWQPPMRGQDYFYDVLIGGFDYSQYPDQSGINTSEQRTTWGSVVVNASNLMLIESPSSSDVETAHTWCTFGDASVQLRTATPAEITVSNDLMLIGVPFETVVSTEDGQVENAIVCISKDGAYYSALTDEAGYVSIENDFLPGEVLLTVTGFNTTTIYENINCIAPSGPYLLLQGYNSEVLSYGESHGLDLTIRNVGVEDANNVTVSISSDDPYVTFDIPMATIANIASDNTVVLENILSVHVEGDAPDGHVAVCTLTMSCGGEVWSYEMDLTLAAPLIEFVSYGYEGELLPGKTLNITASFRNIGSYPALNVYGTYTTSNPYVTVITVDPVEYGDINNDGAVATAAFTIHVSDNAPFGEIIYSTITLSGNYEFSYVAAFEPFIDICNVAVSSYPYDEGFEDEDLPNCWTQEIVSGEGVWTTNHGGLQSHPMQAHSGSYNAFISGSETVVRLVSPVMNLDGAVDPVLSFWHAQSVHDGHQDRLRVYYKNATDGEWQLLAAYQYSVASWKNRIIELPNVTANYYIAFEAECNDGYGVVLDDVNVTAIVSGTKGDANSDGMVNVLDVASVVAYIMGNDPNPFNYNNADFNSDGNIDVIDVMSIANFIINQ